MTRTTKASPRPKWTCESSNGAFEHSTLVASGDSLALTHTEDAVFLLSPQGVEKELKLASARTGASSILSITAGPRGWAIVTDLNDADSALLWCDHEGRLKHITDIGFKHRVAVSEEEVVVVEEIAIAVYQPPHTKTLRRLEAAIPLQGGLAPQLVNGIVVMDVWTADRSDRLLVGIEYMSGKVNWRTALGKRGVYNWMPRAAGGDLAFASDVEDHPVRIVDPQRGITHVASIPQMGADGDTGLMFAKGACVAVATRPSADPLKSEWEFRVLSKNLKQVRQRVQLSTKYPACILLPRPKAALVTGYGVERVDLERGTSKGQLFPDVLMRNAVTLGDSTVLACNTGLMCFKSADLTE